MLSRQFVTFEVAGQFFEKKKQSDHSGDRADNGTLANEVKRPAPHRRRGEECKGHQSHAVQKIDQYRPYCRPSASDGAKTDLECDYDRAAKQCGSP